MTGDEAAAAAALHNEALIELRMAGFSTDVALAFIYPDALDKRTWLCNRLADA
jgi:hypothetical protein